MNLPVPPTKFEKQVAVLETPYVDASEECMRDAVKESDSFCVRSTLFRGNIFMTVSDSVEFCRLVRSA
jgi:hypothetical protein